MVKPWERLKGEGGISQWGEHRSCVRSRIKLLLLEILLGLSRWQDLAPLKRLKKKRGLHYQANRRSCNPELKLLLLYIVLISNSRSVTLPYRKDLGSERAPESGKSPNYPTLLPTYLVISSYTIYNLI